MIWADNKIEKFAYDGWMPVAAYESSDVDGSFLRYTGSWAWGPDLSGTLGGAGGIGGLAIATDDLWDNEHPSNGVGPMVPVYDGNGNIHRLLRALDREVEAKYEYGPFGETRSIDGPLGQHNPFRWSTKYTDSETGLVYYGYQYYSAGLGRWFARDPAMEAAGGSLYACVRGRLGDITDFDDRWAGAQESFRESSMERPRSLLVGSGLGGATAPVIRIGVLISTIRLKLITALAHGKVRACSW